MREISAFGPWYRLPDKLTARMDAQMRMGLKHKRQLQQAAEQLGQNGCPDERILGIEIREVRKVAEAAGRRENFQGAGKERGVESVLW